MAVDVPGANKVMALGERAKGKAEPGGGVPDPPRLALRRAREADPRGPDRPARLGRRSTTSRRPSTGPTGPTPRPAERRLRNWVHDKALSGDIIVEQNIHIIDVTNWLLKGHPVKAVGLGRPRRPHGPGRLLQPLQLRLHLPERRPRRLRLHAVRQGGVGRGHAVLRHEGLRRGPLRRAGAHLGRRPTGSIPGL